MLRTSGCGHDDDHIDDEDDLLGFLISNTSDDLYHLLGSWVSSKRIKRLDTVKPDIY